MDFRVSHVFWESNSCADKLINLGWKIGFSLLGILF